MKPSQEPAPWIESRQPSWLEHCGARFSAMLPAFPMRAGFKRLFHRLLAWQSGGQGMVCRMPDGESLTILPQYRHFAWNKSEYRAFKQALPQGGVALDVGANVGGYSLLFARWAGTAGRVYAFEPAPEAYSGLQQHIVMNGLAATVHAHQMAVSDTVGEVAFSATGSQGNNHLLMEGEQANASVIHIPCTTIDQFCAAEGLQPDFIKIDVEGFELAVLRGAERTIREGGENLALFVEMHPAVWPQLGISKHDIIAELDRLGRKISTIAPTDDPWSMEGCCLQLIPV